MSVVLAATATKLPPEARGAVVVCGSHGGRYPGYLAAKAGVRAVILNDAGIGRDGAGVAALAYLEALGIAAAAVGHASCRIGDPADMLARGLVTRANDVAGLLPGVSCREAAEILAAAPLVTADPPAVGEGRSEVAGVMGRRILLLDSAALVAPGDAGQVIVTGSHGGLVGGDPAMALQVHGFAAVFNDAGRPDGPGATRLPPLAARGIAAITVSAASARIGDAASSYADGIISAANTVAVARAPSAGELARPFLQACAAR